MQTWKRGNGQEGVNVIQDFRSTDCIWIHTAAQKKGTNPKLDGHTEGLSHEVKVRFGAPQGSETFPPHNWNLRTGPA